jgi:hypothetical protein
MTRHPSPFKAQISPIPASLSWQPVVTIASRGSGHLKSGPAGGAGAASKPQVGGGVAGSPWKGWKYHQKPALMETRQAKFRIKSHVTE